MKIKIFPENEIEEQESAHYVQTAIEDEVINVLGYAAKVDIEEVPQEDEQDWS